MGWEQDATQTAFEPKLCTGLEQQEEWPQAIEVSRSQEATLGAWTLTSCVPLWPTPKDSNDIVYLIQLHLVKLFLFRGARKKKSACFPKQSYLRPSSRRDDRRSWDARLMKATSGSLQPSPLTQTQTATLGTDVDLRSRRQPASATSTLSVYHLPSPLEGHKQAKTKGFPSVATRKMIFCQSWPLVLYSLYS